jgi:holo-[acyl-carrier protein] synthase
VIAGIGLDLVEIDRVAGILERSGDRFVDRVLHPQEGRTRIATREGPTHLAGLFAAKEAVMKALGTGMAGANFSDIRIRHHDSGQPWVELEGSAAARAAALGVSSWQLSITHTKSAAAAVAIALRG